MNQALTLAALIIAVIIVGIIFTGNPLFVLCLLLLPQLPYGLLQSNGGYVEEPEDVPQPMGFLQDVE